MRVAHVGTQGLGFDDLTFIEIRKYNSVSLISDVCCLHASWNAFSVHKIQVLASDI